MAQTDSLTESHSQKDSWAPPFRRPKTHPVFRACLFRTANFLVRLAQLELDWEPQMRQGHQTATDAAKLLAAKQAWLLTRASQDWVLPEVGRARVDQALTRNRCSAWLSASILSQHSFTLSESSLTFNPLILLATTFRAGVQAVPGSLGRGWNDLLGEHQHSF